MLVLLAKSVLPHCCRVTLFNSVVQMLDQGPWVVSMQWIMLEIYMHMHAHTCILYSSFHGLKCIVISEQS